MSDEALIDDQSHYEISLTAGQAFVAFVLLLLSLAASFAFGLMIGKGQADERLVVRKEPAVINEGSVIQPKKDRNDGKIVELPVTSDDFKTKTDTTDTTVTSTAPQPVVTETTTTAPAAMPTTTAPPPFDPMLARQVKLPPDVPKLGTPAPQHPSTSAPQHPSTPSSQPVYAQLLSTENQKTAESLAAKLIDGGFTGAYVERSGNAFKVRVRFASESDARNAETKLRTFSKDVWILK